MNGGDHLLTVEGLRTHFFTFEGVARAVEDVAFHLDRGEVLPFHSMGDLRRYAFLVGADMRTISRYVDLPEDFGAPIDTAGCVLVGRAMANHHRRRAQRLWLELPDPDGPRQRMRHEEMMAERAKRDAETARRWDALARRLLGAG